MTETSTRLIGDKAVFAIEYDLVDVGEDNYYGYIWFWINEIRIGANYDDTQIIPYLSSSVSSLKEFIDYKIERRFLGSENIPAECLFFILQERFYKATSSCKEDYEDFGEFRRIFFLEKVGVESFYDNVRIVIIDEKGASRQRFLWKLFDDEVLHEFFIPYGRFEEIAYSYIHQIENDVDNWNDKEAGILI